MPDAASFAGQSGVLSFVLGGLSKSAGLPQLKVGWMIVQGSDDVANPALERLALIADTYLSVSTPPQLATPALIQAGRQFSYAVARKMATGEGRLEAAMVKAYVCRAAEWVTREAMQIHGGMGYAEEFPVSRYYVDARVLSIFEGADETLCLRVIARRLAEQALSS